MRLLPLFLGLMLRLLARPLMVPVADNLVPVAHVEVHDLTDTDVGDAVLDSDMLAHMEAHDISASFGDQYPLRPNGVDDIDGLVIHHSAGPEDQTFNNIDAYHKAKGWKRIGYHQAHRPDGSRWILNADERKTNHIENNNTHFIGHVCIGNYHRKRMSAAMEGSVRAAIMELDERYHFAHIIPHRWRKATACPGDSLVVQLKDLWRDNRLGTK